MCSSFYFSVYRSRTVEYNPATVSVETELATKRCFNPACAITFDVKDLNHDAANVFASTTVLRTVRKQTFSSSPHRVYVFQSYPECTIFVKHLDEWVTNECLTRKLSSSLSLSLSIYLSLSLSLSLLLSLLSTLFKLSSTVLYVVFIEN